MLFRKNVSPRYLVIPYAKLQLTFFCFFPPTCRLYPNLACIPTDAHRRASLFEFLIHRPRGHRARSVASKVLEDYRFPIALEVYTGAAGRRRNISCDLNIGKNSRQTMVSCRYLLYVSFWTRQILPNVVYPQFQLNPSRVFSPSGTIIVFNQTSNHALIDGFIVAH